MPARHQRRRARSHPLADELTADLLLLNDSIEHPHFAIFNFCTFSQPAL